MSKYIDAAFAKAEFTGNFQNSYTPGQIKAILDEVPAADVIEVKHGYWKRLNNDPVNHPMDLLCSECRYMSYKRTDFCPHCGADMRGEENES